MYLRLSPWKRKGIGWERKSAQKGRDFRCKPTWLAALLLLGGWACIVLAFKFEGIPGSRCSYPVDESQRFPYPYTKYAWWAFTKVTKPHPIPRWLLRTIGTDSNKLAVAKNLFSHGFLLPPQVAQRSVSHLGNLSRLRLALTKLLNGEPITMVVLGGSVMGGGEVYYARRNTDSVVGHIFAWINATFPHPHHRLHNGCVPGAGSAFVSVCLKGRIKYNDIDLIMLEFNLNDFNPGGCCGSAVLDSPWRRGLEVLIRRLMLLPSLPAVTYMHMWLPGFFQRSFYNTTIEDQVEVFVQYYGLQSVSIRDAIFRLYAAGAPGFRDEDFTCNDLHPNYLGHRYLADMYISFLQHQIAQVLMDPANDNDRAAAARQVPEPMLSDNYEYKTVCLEETDLQKGVVEAKGWEWVDEPTRYGAHKYGFVSTQPESTIRFKVDSRNPHLASGGAPNTTLALGILKSYAHMGSGSITCVSGCTCQSPTTIFNAHWQQPASLQKWVYFGVTGSAECVLEIRTLAQTTSGEHKLKISALGVLPWSPQQSNMFSMWVVDGLKGDHSQSGLPHEQYEA